MRKQQKKQLPRQETYPIQEKTAYTVTIELKVEVSAYGTYTAALNALQAAGVHAASKVTVVSGNNERKVFIGAWQAENGSLGCERID